MAMNALEVDTKPTSRLDEQQADQIADEVFGGEENVRATTELITRFVASWARHKNEKPVKVWLADELRQFPDHWDGEEAIQSTVREIVGSIEQANAGKKSLYAHLEKGKSKTSWLAGTIEKGAAAAGIADVASYAGDIDKTIQDANWDMMDITHTQEAIVSQNPNLDGFIAEQHHVNTYNMDAAAKGISARARVLKSSAKNSMDIGIYDKGKLVRRVQVKYGKDADATKALFKMKGHDYRGQRKLVPSDQRDRIQGSTDRLEYGGAESERLSKKDAEKRSNRIRRGRKDTQYSWNEVGRIEIAKQIGKHAAMGAAIACVFQGMRLLSRRVWAHMHGKQNPPPSKDLEEFFETSLQSGAHAGIQTAVSGATVVAARNGWVRALQNTPAAWIASIVYVGMENAKALYKFAKNELNGEQALDSMGNTTCSAISGLGGAMLGGAVGGTKLGSVIGSVFGPVGTAVGGLVGGVSGGMAGSKIGEAVWKGCKRIAKFAVKSARRIAEKLKTRIRTLVRRKHRA